MRYTEETDTRSHAMKITVEIDDLEMVGCKTDEFDRRLLRECNRSSSVADKILALETIARRIEEASK